MAFDPSDSAAVQSTIHVVDSICQSAQLIASSTGNMSFLAPLVPTLGHSMFLAAKILVVFGDTLYVNTEYSSQVRLLRACIEVFAKRWKIAGELHSPQVLDSGGLMIADNEFQIATYKRWTQLFKHK